MTKSKHMHLHNEKTQDVEYKYGGFRGSVVMGIPTNFSEGMGWV